ncbi:MAG: PEP-CTERM sorting domain-containing protein [Syntrophobacteraceae bacterium]
MARSWQFIEEARFSNLYAALWANFQKKIAGRFESDNALLDIYINGNPVTFAGEGAMGNWTTFTILDKYLLTGTNTLQFVVNNASEGTGNPGNPTNLRVEYTKANAKADPVPEPGTLVLFIFGLAGLAGYKWKNQA